jgi:dTDP-4-dehydrorhamnose 3,5-epimerase
MSIRVTPTRLPDVKFIVPHIACDDRGFFVETYNRKALREIAGIAVDFVQDNHSRSVQKGVVRGLHFQIEPYAQDKLVRVVRGSIFDVAVDIRVGSPTFAQHVSARLSAQNQAQLWIPKGFAHGLCTLEPETEVIYKVSAYYDQASDKGLAWDDPQLGIVWPLTAGAAILSEKDRAQPRLGDLPAYFTYGSRQSHA